MTKPDALSVLSADVCSTDDTLVVTVRLRNDADRALHYIASVRSIQYDPATRRLTLRLSDEGRVVVPGAAIVRPKFRHIDPNSEAELTLTVPAEIVMLAAPPDPERRRVAFQKHRLTDAEEIVVEIAWSDTPYYEETRDVDDPRMPTVRWQQHEARIVHRR